jgi:hypothetical protein
MSTKQKESEATLSRLTNALNGVSISSRAALEAVGTLGSCHATLHSVGTSLDAIHTTIVDRADDFEAATERARYALQRLKRIALTTEDGALFIESRAARWGEIRSKIVPRLKEREDIVNTLTLKAEEFLKAAIEDEKSKVVRDGEVTQASAITLAATTAIAASDASTVADTKRANEALAATPALRVQLDAAKAAVSVATILAENKRTLRADARASVSARAAASALSLGEARAVAVDAENKALAGAAAAKNAEQVAAAAEARALDKASAVQSAKAALAALEPTLTAARDELSVMATSLEAAQAGTAAARRDNDEIKAAAVNWRDAERSRVAASSTAAVRGLELAGLQASLRTAHLNAKLCEVLIDAQARADAKARELVTKGSVAEVHTTLTDSEVSLNAARAVLFDAAATPAASDDEIEHSGGSTAIVDAANQALVALATAESERKTLHKTASAVASVSGGGSGVTLSAAVAAIATTLPLYSAALQALATPIHTLAERARSQLIGRAAAAEAAADAAITAAADVRRARSRVAEAAVKARATTTATEAFVARVRTVIANGVAKDNLKIQSIEEEVQARCAALRATKEDQIAVAEAAGIASAAEKEKILKKQAELRAKLATGPPPLPPPPPPPVPILAPPSEKETVQSRKRRASAVLPDSPEDSPAEDDKSPQVGHSNAGEENSMIRGISHAQSVARHGTGVRAPLVHIETAPRPKVAARTPVETLAASRPLPPSILARTVSIRGPTLPPPPPKQQQLAPAPPTKVVSFVAKANTGRASSSGRGLSPLPDSPPAVGPGVAARRFASTLFASRPPPPPPQLPPAPQTSGGVAITTTARGSVRPRLSMGGGGGGGGGGRVSTGSLRAALSGFGGGSESDEEVPKPARVPLPPPQPKTKPAGGGGGGGGVVGRGGGSVPIKRTVVTAAPVDITDTGSVAGSESGLFSSNIFTRGPGVRR